MAADRFKCESECAKAMIFRRSKSYSITLQRAHSLLKIPRDGELRITQSGNNNGSDCSAAIISRDQIQQAFRVAAKRHHPDLLNSTNKSIESRSVTATLNKEANTTFRECYEARELLLDYYIRKKFVHPEIIESCKDKPSEKYRDETWFSVWRNERSFQIEVFLRLSLCLGLAVGTYYHDLYVPERRKQQIKQRDAQYYNFGPQPPRW